MIRPEVPEDRLRRNHEIRAREVRLIGEDGKQLGVVPIREAIEAADEAGLDLIEVAPEANPPVCRIMDWGRFRYEQKQRERQQRKKQRSVEVKSLRLRPATGDHDFNVVRRKAHNFLSEGNKVRVEVRFRGREITHRELGQDILLKLADAVSAIADIEQAPHMDGRKMFLMLAPNAETLEAWETERARREAAGEQIEQAGEDDSDEDDELDDELGDDQPADDAAEATTSEADEDDERLPE